MDTVQAVEIRCPNCRADIWLRPNIERAMFSRSSVSVTFMTTHVTHECPAFQIHTREEK